MTNFTMTSKMLMFIVFAFVTLHSTSVAAKHIHDPTLNNRPIIGILAQELSTYFQGAYPHNYTCHIPASYVKFVEGAGARVVPIWIGMPEEYYEDIMSNINGVLLPGGAALFNQSNGYADAGYHIYNVAKRMNKKGDYFPIFGICLGFELLTVLAARRFDHRISCNSEDQRVPLKFQPGYMNSRMFQNASQNIIDILRNDDVAANYHHYCVTQQGLKIANIDNQFRVLSTNNDLNGVRFISSLEHVNLPFYGVQFHPEKNMYEWLVGKKIPHGNHPTQAGQYFAEFFVNEARKSGHSYPASEETSRLIYNYPVTYTGLRNSVYVQVYFFKDSDLRKNNIWYDDE